MPSTNPLIAPTRKKLQVIKLIVPIICDAIAMPLRRGARLAIESVCSFIAVSNGRQWNQIKIILWIDYKSERLANKAPQRNFTCQPLTLRLNDETNGRTTTLLTSYPADWRCRQRLPYRNQNRDKNEHLPDHYLCQQHGLKDLSFSVRGQVSIS